MIFGKLPDAQVALPRYQTMSVAAMPEDEFKARLADDKFSSLTYLDIAAVKDDEAAIEKATAIFRSGNRCC